VGAAVVARQTSLTNALLNGSCSMIGTQDPSSSDQASTHYVQQIWTFCQDLSLCK
jgi:hypothetical protein